MAMFETTNEQTLKRLRALCLALPDTSETASWGHPNFKAGKKMFVAFERVKGRASIAFRLHPDDVNRLVERKTFFVTPYGRGQWVSLWADARVNWRAVEALVKRSYRLVRSNGKGQRSKARVRVQVKDKGPGQR
jgi:predicted DNA-binding protein (MmcQ/YjbR family)